MKDITTYYNGNHRTIVFEDGTKIKETGCFHFYESGNLFQWEPDDSDHFTYSIPEIFDIKITDYCDGGCIYCCENSSVNGKHGDIKSLTTFINTLMAGCECNITGGNPLSHPDLIWFLTELKNHGIITNITINQRHIKQYKDLIMKIVAEKLVFGIGISLADSHNKDDFKFIDSLGNNVVIHTIAGILNKHDLTALTGRKVLILGYKDLNRGHTLYEEKNLEIKKNMDWLRRKLPALQSMCKVISFDSLGIEQIKPHRVLHLTTEYYDELYQQNNNIFDVNGNIIWDRMYVDVPNMKVATSINASTNDFYSFNVNDTFMQMFNKAVNKDVK